jgi:cysteine desulfurase / selenocysteine lyase
VCADQCDQVDPAAAVGRIARSGGIPCSLDALQSLGKMPIGIKAIGCDMLYATGRRRSRLTMGTSDE